MGSLVPFQDLNLSPDPPQATSAIATTFSATTPLLIPKIEPKQEPYTESEPEPSPIPQPEHLQDQPLFSFSHSAPSFFYNPQLTPQSQPSSSSSDHNNILQDYLRVTSRFRAAFAQSLQNYSDAGIVGPNSRAIVSVSEGNTQDNEAHSIVECRRRAHRSIELVRITNLANQEELYFRNVIRRTRMMYDSLRILSMMEDVKQKGPSHGRRARGDLKASAMMRQRGFWLNRDKRIVGTIPGVRIGDVFFFRMEMCVLGLHGQPQAGIDYLPSSFSANGEPIATSIIVSGGYEDDQDAGDMIVYTGHGGQDKFSKQCKDQKLEGGNLALERSLHHGIEVRVIRGFRYQNNVSSKVYVYDGLYKIVDYWFEVGKSGFGVYKYKLLRMMGQPEMGSSIMRFAENLRTKPLAARPMGYLSLDMSMQKENVPVRLYNDIDNDQDPLCYEYLPKTKFPSFVVASGSSGTGCDCVSGCTEGCICAMKNGGEFAYDYNGLLLRGKPVIFECGTFCQCPPTCRNRVTQNGLGYKLEVFRSRETGWGVRSLDLIQAGAFICEYAGVVLTKEQAELLSVNGDCFVYPSRFSKRFEEWGNLSQILPDFVRPSHPSIPPLDFALDVSKTRNVACYISHSSIPNVLVQFVLYEHSNLMFPHLMLFAMENIPPLRELSLDYGVPDEYTGKLSICN